MLGISLGPWLHAEAIGGIVQHSKQFLKSKTSASDDFWDFMVSKALQNQKFAKTRSKNEDFEDNAPRSWAQIKFSIALRTSN